MPDAFNLLRALSKLRERRKAILTRRLLAHLPRYVQRDIGVHPSGAPMNPQRGNH